MSKLYFKISLFKQYFAFSLLTLIISFISMKIIFDNIILSLIFSLILTNLSVKQYDVFVYQKNQRRLLTQFSEFLNSLSTSLVSGRNTYSSFKASYDEMSKLFGESSEISLQIKLIMDAYNNGDSISNKLREFGNTSNIEDIKDFSEVFSIGNKYGGDLSQIVYESRKIINEKIFVEMEIERQIIQKKYELMIMTIMPFVVIIALNGFNPGKVEGLLLVSRILVLLCIFIANKIGKKIIDIR